MIYFFSPVNGTRGKNIVGIVSKMMENSTIELKCPICNSEETCNTSEYNFNHILIWQIDDLEVLSKHFNFRIS